MPIVLVKLLDLFYETGLRSCLYRFRYSKSMCEKFRDRMLWITE